MERVSFHLCFHFTSPFRGGENDEINSKMYSWNKHVQMWKNPRHRILTHRVSILMAGKIKWNKKPKNRNKKNQMAAETDAAIKDLEDTE